jgi:hypothetical protein
VLTFPLLVYKKVMKKIRWEQSRGVREIADVLENGMHSLPLELRPGIRFTVSLMRSTVNSVMKDFN